MTDLERVKSWLSHGDEVEQELAADVDAHLKEDAETANFLSQRHELDEVALAELREELRLVKHNYEALARHVRASRRSHD